MKLIRKKQQCISTTEITVNKLDTSENLLTKFFLDHIEYDCGFSHNFDITDGNNKVSIELSFGIDEDELYFNRFDVSAGLFDYEGDLICEIQLNETVIMDWIISKANISNQNYLDRIDTYRTLNIYR